jgi:hypothetical protein
MAEEKTTAGGIPLELPSELVERVRLRKRFVDTVGAMLKEGSDDEDDDEGDARRKTRGRIAMVHFPTPTLLPDMSIYEGAEEEAERELGWPFRSVVAGVVEPPNGSTGGTGSAVGGGNGTSG